MFVSISYFHQTIDFIRYLQSLTGYCNMPTNTRQCVICKKIASVSKKDYMKIASNDSENKLRMGYWSRLQIDVSNQSLINNYVHKQCYSKITRKSSPI